MRTRRHIVTSLLACAVVAAPVFTAPVHAADPETPTYVLPGVDIYPEGVAVFGGQYYVGSFFNGSLYRGDLDRPDAELFVHAEGDPNTTGAGGIKATATRLVTAGVLDGIGVVWVYDRRTGDLVARFTNGLSWLDGVTNVNDVAIAPNGDAYVTDSAYPAVYRIPASALREQRSGLQELPVFMSLEGTVFEYLPSSVNANGIVATPNGYLIIGNFETGRLYRIRLSDKQVTEIDLGGADLTGADGFVLRGRTLWVVRFWTETVAKLTMNHSFSSARLVSETTDATFQGPTTAAIARGRMLVVNSQFSGPGEPPFTVSSIAVP